MRAKQKSRNGRRALRMALCAAQPAASGRMLGRSHDALPIRGGGYRRSYSPQTLIGKASWDLPSIRPDAAGWAAHKAIRNARLPFRDFCFARIDSEGNERHIAISGEPMFAGGRFIGYRGVGSDVTDRRRAEERQDAHARHQEIIAEFGRNALRLHDPQALLDEAARGAAHALGAEA